MDIDFGILDLLASKICHDLVSPVGAINNGIELIEDVGGGMASEAMKLIASSAALANHRLKLFRLTYGRGGSDPGLKLEDARAIMLGALAASKMTLDWPPHLWPEQWKERRGAFKVALNIILLAEEALPHGGTITLAAPTPTSLAIMAHGRGAHLSPDNQTALAAHAKDGGGKDAATTHDAIVQTITPRTVQAYYASRLAARYGFAITFESAAPNAESVIFRIAHS